MPKYAEEILAAVTELQRHPTAEQVFLEMKREPYLLCACAVRNPVLFCCGRRKGRNSLEKHVRYKKVRVSP